MVAPKENRLGAETSPYLRQHRFDPVDWFPWGEEAKARAEELDRPLFVSIGYSACHWCHVMAHESFSNEETAVLMNESVVAVKVDREERPDVDAVYMESVLAATGQGGWPMSIFATPDGRPFFAGTYFPGSPRSGMPSFVQVLGAVASAWENRRSEVEAQADSLARAVANRLTPPPPLVGVDERDVLSAAHLEASLRGALGRLGEMADLLEGGFGSAPKFAQPLLLDLLLRAAAAGIVPASGPGPLEIVEKTLSAMASGGIYDQLGGGFCRYSVDSHFMVPHFEKMLYDQALLARVYLHAWQLTGDARWRQIMDETLGYVLSRLRSRDGGLFSAEDADSEGEEGRFYLWSKEEVSRLLGPELGPLAVEWYGVSEQGNFEGRNILHRAVKGDLFRSPEIEQARQLLFAEREKRVHPGLDDKVLTEWNAMACSVLAEAAAVTGSPAYTKAAEDVASLLLRAREENNGRTPRLVGGKRPLDGVAGDVAWLAEALVRLFELTGRPSYLRVAEEVADELVANFLDEKGNVFTTRQDGERLIVRPGERHDGVIPSAGSVGAVALSRLGTLLGSSKWLERARQMVSACSEELERAPVAVPELLLAAEVLSAPVEVVTIGAATQFLVALRWRFAPRAVYCWPAPGEETAGLALLAGRDEEAVYICRAGACRLPARDLATAQEELEVVLGATPGEETR
jgi:uncharacterized protein YyaL (SSP411 family)